MNECENHRSGAMIAASLLSHCPTQDRGTLNVYCPFIVKIEHKAGYGGTHQESQIHKRQAEYGKIEVSGQSE
jgi:hypothetical protein